MNLQSLQQQDSPSIIGNDIFRERYLIYILRERHFIYIFSVKLVLLPRSGDPDGF